MSKLLAEVSFKYYHFANSILEKKDIYLGVVNLTNNYIFSENAKISYFNSKVDAKSNIDFDISIPKIKICKFLKDNSKIVQIYSLKSENSIIYKVRLDFLDTEHICLYSIIVDTDIKIYPISPYSYINYISDKNNYPVVISQKILRYINKFLKEGFVIEPILIKFNKFSENKKLVLINSHLKNEGLLFINY